MRKFTTLSLVSGLVLSAGAVVADAGDVQQIDGYTVETIADGIDFPWCVAFLPDGDMLVTEKRGKLFRVSPDGVKSEISGVPAVLYDKQGGLFDVMLADDFATSGNLFLSYAAGSKSSNHTEVTRARLDGDKLVDQKVVFAASPDKATSVHFGGRMVQLPDGSIVLTLGDGFRYREEAQKTSSHIGTVVRFNPDGSVPDDNPYIGVDGALPEIYSIGHRSVQGLVYDAPTGTLWSHEHGAQGGDELNLEKPGGNFGWPLATTGIDYTGARITPFEHYPGTEAFTYDWVPSIAPSGMVRYRGDLMPEWDGDFLIGGLASMDVRLLEMEGDKVVNEQILFEELEDRIRDIRTGPDGAVYLLTDNDDGRLIRITPGN